MNHDFDALMNGLQGGITAGEGALLRDLAAEAVGGCIIEVGSYRGKSAVALALGVRSKRGEPATRIYCIEPHQPFTGVYGGRFGPEDRDAFYRAMRETDAFREVALVNLSSEAVAPAWDEPVALAFIDGDHRYAGVRRDFENWDPHVLLGGVIAFDDATDTAGGPARLVAEIEAEGRYRRIGGVGKVVVLRKVRPGRMPMSARPLRILVACENIVRNGGLLRFDRVARAIAPGGHSLSFVALGEARPDERATDVPVVSWDDAANATWDAVMVPGAGFSDATIERFAALRAPNFGVRVQHVLNDRTLRERFRRVNDAFAPDVVVFNNRDWPVGTFTDFQAKRFHRLEGAVDAEVFRPRAYRTHPLRAGEWIVGGLAAKNPAPLVAALRALPDTVRLRLYGPDKAALASAHADLVASGRLQLDGPKDESELRAFYDDVDCVVSSEAHAGWANLAAEAMACGVPVVCTRHGTAAFARDGENALVVEPEADAIARAIERLRDDAALCRDLAERAREAIGAFSWERYSRALLALLARDETAHYVHAPEFGLFGKWPLEERLDGLAPLLERMQGASLVDFGCAEGFVAREFLRHGAALVHGFELDAFRVACARAICAEFGERATFRSANLSDPAAFRAANADLLRERYDGVLYLGIHHHIDATARTAMLRDAIALAARWFALRTSHALAEADGVFAELEAAGFVRIVGAASLQAAHLGELSLWERR
ncbi:MAG: class I SAM-dependent methyltransferase [Rhodanobacteraceae bacterium]